MRFTIENISDNPTTALRRAGYTYQHRTDQDELSFVRVMGQSGYPRFHMYVKLDGRTLNISFHIDHKKNTYGDSTRHHGEYESSTTLDQEATRIKSIVR